ncbi:Streptomyces cyclase/dehydrase [Calothrix sp. NIES-4071]|nr:Streptomyces cyclase/dehydrase [Calothrix sp. NIES-4071]BAZ60967.1 Streptomyces cyclase/dehydrase [Calothrix sp. NIES-4105]
MKLTHNAPTVTQQYNTTSESDISDPQQNDMAPSPELEAIEVVIDKIAERRRQITAAVEIKRPREIVWNVLTNYEALPEFIPSLHSSQRLQHPQGGIRVEQVGRERLLKLNFSARVVLDLFESYPKEINFQMVEGDFKEYSGSWQLQPCTNKESTTNLCYTLNVHPKRLMPVGIIEQRLSSGLKVNLLAIKKHVESL